MDYEKLVDAVKDGKKEELNSLYTETFGILCSYLRTTMRASGPDAEDCAQHAFLMTVERIQKNAIREPESLYSYLIQSAKNKYLRVRFENNRSNYQEDIEAYLPIEDQIDSLVTKEEQKALEDCVDRLPDNSKTFINYWFEYPESQARDVARKFKLSVSNVWTKKHRIIKKISECVQKKLNI